MIPPNWKRFLFITNKKNHQYYQGFPRLLLTDSPILPLYFKVTKFDFYREHSKKSSLYFKIFRIK